MHSPRNAAFAEALFPGNAHGLAAALGYQAALCGSLVIHRPDTGAIGDLPASLIALWAGWSGDVSAFADAVRRTLLDEKGCWHDWHEKQAKLIERREDARERMREQRAEKRAQNSSRNSSQNSSQNISQNSSDESSLNGSHARTDERTNERTNETNNASSLGARDAEVFADAIGKFPSVVAFAAASPDYTAVLHRTLERVLGAVGEQGLAGFVGEVNAALQGMYSKPLEPPALARALADWCDNAAPVNKRHFRAYFHGDRSGAAGQRANRSPRPTRPQSRIAAEGAAAAWKLE
ncbi:MAG TPA: hypothetical protein VIP11_25110 [Gemmatimonadaceae bacterium]